MGRKHKETTPISPAELAAVRAALTPVPLDTIPWDNIAKAVYTAELADTPAIPTAETLPVVMVKGPDTTSVEIEWFPPNELANPPAIPTADLIADSLRPTPKHINLDYVDMADVRKTLPTTPMEGLSTADPPTDTLSLTPTDTQQDTGDTAAAAAVDAGTAAAYTRGTENRMQAKHRWIRAGILPEVEAWMAGKRSEIRDTGLARHRANDMAWEAAIAHFPPPGQEPAEIAPVPVEQPQEAPGGLVQGLGTIPVTWPTLPDNASLQAELGWVQSQRLSIVEERGNTTVVHLERASSPAPSKAALGWLETSIRSYAKYVDIVSRALSTQVDEQEHIRRERMRLDEITSLLDEMQGAC